MTIREICNLFGGRHSASRITGIDDNFLKDLCKMNISVSDMDGRLVRKILDGLDKHALELKSAKVKILGDRF